jgi:putative membrane protein
MNMKALWLTIYFAVLIWSAVSPKDDLTWLLEVAPALIGFAVLAATHRRFPLTPLAYWLTLVHMLILMVGGHYTYAEVPLFDWLRDSFHWQRNNYDKLGHIAQGFVPALLAREVLLRQAVINGRAWLNFFVVCFALALSALYELLEWAVAAASGDSAVAFLATQGDEWDTQSDMGLALLGAILALVVLARAHDRQLAALKGAP